MTLTHFPRSVTGGLQYMDQFVANGAFFLQLVLAHVPHICLVSLVLVLFHFPAELC